MFLGYLSIPADPWSRLLYNMISFQQSEVKKTAWRPV